MTGSGPSQQSCDRSRRTGPALRQAGAGQVAIERPGGTVADTLLEAGLTVVVISPNQALCDMTERPGCGSDPMAQDK